MERPESPESSQWVTVCLVLLAPPAAWEPNLNAARARIAARSDASLRRRSSLRRCFLVGAIATLIVCIAVPSIPQTWVLAQQAGNSGWQRLEQLWYWFTLIRGGPMLLGHLPAAMKSLHTQPLGKPGLPYPVSSPEEARLRAGFTPRLPNASARLSVAGPMSLVSVTSDGTQLTLQLGASVTAAWSDLTLTQSPMPVVAAPPGFDLADFAFTTLRAAGLRNSAMAQRLAQLPTTAPAFLFGCLPPHFVGVRQVTLRTGAATLIEELGGGDLDSFGPTVERITLLWSVPDRVYVLTAVTKIPATMLSLDLAAALASAIDLANSIN